MQRSPEKGVVALESHLLSGQQELLSYVRRRIADPELAEDVLQTSLLKALEAAPNLKDEERLVPWFYRILQNAIVDAYRRKGVERKHVEFLGEIDPAEDPLEQAALCACFQELLPSLRPEYAELIESMELRGESTHAATNRLGITPNNLKVRRHRARQALRRRLEETCRMCAEHHCLDCTCRAE